MLRMNGQLQEITIVRGDSGVIKVVDHDLTKTERPFSEGTVVSLGVKRAVRDEEYLLLKQVTSFSPEVTSCGNSSLYMPHMSFLCLLQSLQLIGASGKH